LGQDLSGLCQPAGNRSFGDAESDRSVLATPAIEFAQHNHCPEVFRQGCDFSVEGAQGVGIRFVPGGGWAVRKRSGWNLPGTAACRHNSGLLSGAGSYPIEPSPDCLAWTDVGGAACQDKEHRLERILGLVHIRSHTPTYPQHHGAEAANQFGKRFLVPTPDETGEQLPISGSRLGTLESTPQSGDSS
jgi:hypothetical protein